MKVAILGAGESGTGAAILAKQLGYQVKVSDGGVIAEPYRHQLQQYHIDFEEKGHTLEEILAADQIVKSPGIADTVPVVKAALAKGIPVISEIEFAARYTSARFIAISGTNGKTTTTLLTYHLLKSGEQKVVLAGNVGESFARQVAIERREGTSVDWYVLEISSFQLDNCYWFHPQIAVLLNITPDHLDRYQNSMELYTAAKLRLLQNMNSNDAFIYYAQDPILSAAVARCPVAAKVFPITQEQFAGDYIQVAGHRFGQLPLVGKHNMINMAAAIQAALLAGATPQQVQQALPNFVNAPHRLQKVGEWNGVTFINDSKATNVDAAMYALGAFQRPIIWIAGGKDKGNDYDLIRHLVQQKVKALVCMGKDNSKLYNYFSGIVPQIADTHSMEEAIKAAWDFACPGDVVLLSPACASFDLFQNYQDRGKQFADMCQQLGPIKQRETAELA
ncbi:MAG: UDP-N-acetylmuramoyl-L-alanine--D-glutamate ligase [Cytophagales bacterium]|nr:UDP-N-acetylmuramoyl-L-alanine--D-glutamate ligase [Bernardetiaceae bacterium]MDW8211673.1 UDP-N-acetylmuramoyl-L-alanine--D-glutamate ligase [Cytophagales bacterium]